MVHFDALKGKPSFEFKNVVSGDQIGTLPVCSKEGFSFNGWYLNEEGTGDKISSDTIISSNSTFYANYSQLT